MRILGQKLVFKAITVPKCSIQDINCIKLIKMTCGVSRKKSINPPLFKILASKLRVLTRKFRTFSHSITSVVYLKSEIRNIQAEFFNGISFIDQKKSELLFISFKF